MSIFVWAWTHFCNVAVAVFLLCWCHSTYTKHKNPSTENLFDVMIFRRNKLLLIVLQCVSLHCIVCSPPYLSLALSRLKITQEKYFLNLDSYFLYYFILLCSLQPENSFFTSKSTLNVLKFFSTFLHSLLFCSVSKVIEKVAVRRTFFYFIG